MWNTKMCINIENGEIYLISTRINKNNKFKIFQLKFIGGGILIII